MKARRPACASVLAAAIGLSSPTVGTNVANAQPGAPCGPGSCQGPGGGPQHGQGGPGGPQGPQQGPPP